VVVTTNGRDALGLGAEDLDTEDDNGLWKRIFHVDSRGGGADTYLAERDVSAWATLDGPLCQHLEWIAQHWRVTQDDGRFAVAGVQNDWVRTVAEREGMPQRVLEAVARAATGSDTKCYDPMPCLYLSDTEILVSAHGLQKHWRDLTGDQRVPTLSAVGRALRRIGQRRQFRRVWWYVLPIGMVADVADDLGLPNLVDSLARRGVKAVSCTNSPQK
jgi:hypothetical protein